MQKYNIILNFGYAESQGLGYVPFESSKQFASPKEAFIDLANFLKKACEGEKILKKCCEKNKKENINYCPKCGSNLNTEELDYDTFVAFLGQIESANFDSYSGLIGGYDEDHCWQPECINLNGNNIIISEAEKCLAAAIGLNYRDNITIDNIFGKTETEGEPVINFGYWL